MEERSLHLNTLLVVQSCPERWSNLFHPHHFAHSLVVVEIDPFAETDHCIAIFRTPHNLFHNTSNYNDCDARESSLARQGLEKE